MLYRIFSKRITGLALIVILLLYFAFWWFYKLDMLPGLHGDEAWAGLKAHDYQTQSLDRLSGMTYYTGVLQSLIVELSFNTFGLGVYQLRVPGAVVNLAALVVIASMFVSYRLYKEAVLFLLMLGSSSLYVISARIAWEVNTFTLFFIAISFASLMVIYRSKKKPLLWVCLFWLANIFGSYNHIIYSCISVAGFFGAMLWAIQRGSILNGKALLLTGINCLNVVIIYLLLRYNLNYIFLHLAYLPLYLAGLICLECAFFYSLSDFTVKIGFLAPRFNHIIILLLCLTFIYYHGKGFFDVLSEYKFILQAYSYECSLIFQVVFAVGATVFVVITGKVLLNDLTKRTSKTTLFAFVIICYIALLAAYTTKNSLRYYLILYAVLCLYLAFKLNLKDKLGKVLIASQLILAVLVNGALLDIFIHDPIPVRAIDFKIGNGQEETSSALLPKKPLIDFLRTNHISKIEYLCYPYFIEQPIKFYKLISPWTELKKDSAIIDYDYLKYKDGFFVIKAE